MDRRFVTLVTANPPLTVTALRGQAPPVPAGGYGGWQITPRPHRKSMTQWSGIDPRRILVPLLLGVTPAGDAYVNDTSAEPDRERLERMAQADGHGTEPPLVRVLGSVPHAELDWVIDDFDWDASPIYSAKGFLVRQAVTVHLLEYVREDRINDASAAELARRASSALSAAAAKSAGGSSNQPSRAKVYVVRAGDTLSSIAARMLGNYKRWTEIATLNGIRDPKALKVGAKLRLP